MKRSILVFLGVLLPLLLWLANRKSPPQQASETITSDAPPASQLPARAALVAIITSSETTELAVATESLRLLDASSNAQQDLVIIQQLVHEYRRQYGGNPVGDNQEIMAALSGANQKKLAYLAKDVMRLVDRDGCLLDRWGTPYFFHAQSAREMEIISAGPDGIHYTSDDVRE